MRGYMGGGGVECGRGGGRRAGGGDTIVQSSGLASGTNSRSAASCCALDETTSARRYRTSGRLAIAIAAVGSTLAGVKVLSQSHQLPPTLKTAGLKPANGPKKMQSCP